ncbi:dTDP-4-dehydrorhamnose reductase [Spongiibacter sp. IMCC21906]|uniref:dTDP-4-dehydrorhamnose reductase n=1 Tax=Spongiibacter sp. IMCC21906 TaxID=1620392 RepID=UPI00062DCE2C|nr:dTDP-4-dehydrorhamnose reductase [Spongiibacter sp. IMCC21906]AKH68649.1 dTDP-4-dehydrorhamnose reductase [Spongiibacter sp. IMCC21906]
MMRILLTGGAGFIGSAVVRHILANTDVNVDCLTYAGNAESIPTALQNSRYVFDRVDICSAAELKRVFDQHQPDAVMHLAAESHVDRSIDGPDAFIQTDLVGTYTLLKAARAYWQNLSQAKQAAFRFHHISTDYVFDGSKTTPYTEDDEPNPQSVYGLTKLKGEQEIQKRWDKHVILRTTWVFSEYGNNFVKTMLRLGKERDELNVVDDQIGCPTYAGDIAKACLAICEAHSSDKAKYGLYHFAGDEAISWCGFAKAIFAEALVQQKLDKAPMVRVIISAQYPALAKRPSNSALGSGKFKRIFGSASRSWRLGLAGMMAC